jgi:Rrf2 family cysteine metabolism transcriptional repressor
MELSAKAEYACLAMAELAAQHEKRMPTSLKAIAERFKISHPFLMQIFMQLKGARLVKSLRGPSGGYQLARAPETVTLLDIVDVIDGPGKETTGLNSLPEVPLIGLLEQVRCEARQAARHVLNTVTLGELVRRARGAGLLEYQI